MEPVSFLVLGVVVPYLVSLAAGVQADVTLTAHRKQVADALAAEREASAKRREALRGRQSIEQQLERVAADAGRLMTTFGVPRAVSDALCTLLDEPSFRADLVAWLRHWYLSIADDARARLEVQMRAAGLPEDFVTGFFSAAEHVVFADPVFANWRLHVALRAAGDEREELLRRLRERDGIFDSKALEAAEALYRDRVLETHDIIDLAGLPEDDRGLAMKRLVLRQLYIPLRAKAEPRRTETTADEPTDAMLQRWEQARARPGEASDDERVAVGALLTDDRRVVVLGDPGAGKTTLMRWLTTAFLLRLSQDADLAALPDVGTLPNEDWLPILIRCRELPANADRCGVEALLEGHLDQLLLRAVDKPAVRAQLHARLEAGTALLIVDGLDEIGDAQARARFCRRLEMLARLYRQTPMIATSRIVGYREMPTRLSGAFRHATLADLTVDDMDDFARRWAATTEVENRQQRVADDLIRNVHSSERVERLARNPMLLTTLALVHRKIGRLPQRRHQLYREALSVLLNWRGELDERLTWDEAVPQLEYIAYAMCDSGRQQLTRDRVLTLIEEMRAAYGQRLRDVNRRSPEAFLTLLERRSSLLVEAGRKPVDGREVAVYEFRHLTFQEYLAALALVDGRFPGHVRGVRLPARVRPLAGRMEERKDLDFEVSESWREPLRLCAVECSDDDVDETLLAILQRSDTEAEGSTTRPRAVMAALCLADEPNVAEETAAEVIAKLVSVVDVWDGEGQIDTPVDAAAAALARSAWCRRTRLALVAAVQPTVTKPERSRLGLAGVMGGARMSTEPASDWPSHLVTRLAGSDVRIRTLAALTAMHLAYVSAEGSHALIAESVLADALVAQLEEGGVAAYAAIWALYWFANCSWRPTEEQAECVLRYLDQSQHEDERRFALESLKNAPYPAVRAAIARYRA